MQEVTIKLKEMFPGLDSLTDRFAGFKVRQVMQNLLGVLPDDSLIENDVVVVLDFEGIGLITQGFGDELVGVFTRMFGVDFIKRHIRVINANEFVRGTLNWCVSYSKKMRAEMQGATA
jgi:hypothetical protein